MATVKSKSAFSWLENSTLLFRHLIKREDVFILHSKYNGQSKTEKSVMEFQCTD